MGNCTYHALCKEKLHIITTLLALLLLLHFIFPPSVRFFEAKTMEENGSWEMVEEADPKHQENLHYVRLNIKCNKVYISFSFSVLHIFFIWFFQIDKLYFLLDFFGFFFLFGMLKSSVFSCRNPIFLVFRAINF